MFYVSATFVFLGEGREWESDWNWFSRHFLAVIRIRIKTYLQIFNSFKEILQIKKKKKKKKKKKCCIKTLQSKYLRCLSISSVRKYETSRFKYEIARG